MNKCSKCGNEFEGKFCSDCGTPFDVLTSEAKNSTAINPQPFKAAKMVVKQETYVVPPLKASVSQTKQPLVNAVTPPHMLSRH